MYYYYSFLIFYSLRIEFKSGEKIKNINAPLSFKTPINTNVCISINLSIIQPNLLSLYILKLCMSCKLITGRHCTLLRYILTFFTKKTIMDRLNLLFTLPWADCRLLCSVWPIDPPSCYQWPNHNLYFYNTYILIGRWRVSYFWTINNSFFVQLRFI